MLDRRSLLVSASAGAAALALPRLAQAQGAPGELTPLLDQFFKERLRIIWDHIRQFAEAGAAVP